MAARQVGAEQRKVHGRSSQVCGGVLYVYVVVTFESVETDVWKGDEA